MPLIKNEYVRHGLAAGWYAAGNERRELRQQAEDRTIAKIQKGLEIRSKILDIESQKRQGKLEEEFGRREAKAITEAREEGVTDLQQAREIRAAREGRDVEQFETGRSARELEEMQAKAQAGNVAAAADLQRLEIDNNRRQLVMGSTEQQFAQVHQVLTMSQQSPAMFDRMAANPQTAALMEGMGITEYNPEAASEVLADIQNARIDSLANIEAERVTRAKGEIEFQKSMLKHQNVAEYEYYLSLPPHLQEDFRRQQMRSLAGKGEKYYGTKARMLNTEAAADIVARLEQVGGPQMMQLLNDPESSLQDVVTKVSSQVAQRLMRLPESTRLESYESELLNALDIIKLTQPPPVQGIIDRILNRAGEEQPVSVQYEGTLPEVEEEIIDLE